MDATIKDLRLHTKKLLSATARGEEVIITYRGTPTAKLVPLVAEPAAVLQTRANPAFGLWREENDQESVEEQVRRLRQPRGDRGAD